MIVDAVGLAATASYAESTMRRTPPPLTETSKLLGLSTDELTSDMESGKTLSSLAGQKGVSSSMLVASVESDLKSNAPAGSTASGGQLKQIASKMIQGGSAASAAGRSGSGPWSGGVSSLGATSSTAASNNLNSLATATGLSPGSLLSRLQSGQDLSSLLGSAGQTGYGSSVASSVRGGVMYDEYA